MRKMSLDREMQIKFSSWNIQWDAVPSKHLWSNFGWSST